MSEDPYANPIPGFSGVVTRPRLDVVQESVGSSDDEVIVDF